MTGTAPTPDAIRRRAREASRRGAPAPRFAAEPRPHRRAAVTRRPEIHTGASHPAEVPYPPPSPVWLVRADGTRLCVGPAGRVLGRSPGCDLVLGPGAADVEAVVWPRDGGVEVVPRTGPTARRSRLGDGDSIDVGGERLTIRSDPTPRPSPALVLWIGDSGAYGLGRLPLAIGGSPTDDLSHPRWPPGAARFESGGSGIVLVLGCDGVVDGHPVPAGSRLPVTVGLVVALDALRLEVRAAADPVPVLPTRVRLVFRPGVARLGLWRSAAEPPASLALSELRGRLLATLLAAGPRVEVEDEQLISAVWDRTVVRTRLDVNQLVHRTRRDLSRAGFDGAAMLERLRAGGATTLHLAPGATIELG